MKKAYRDHVGAGFGPLCGSNSFTANINCTDCTACNKRVDALLDLLLAASKGENVRERAAALVTKWRLSVDDPAETTSQS